MTYGQVELSVDADILFEDNRHWWVTHNVLRGPRVDFFYDLFRQFEEREREQGYQFLAQQVERDPENYVDDYSDDLLDEYQDELIDDTFDFDSIVSTSEVQGQSNFLQGILFGVKVAEALGDDSFDSDTSDDEVDSDFDDGAPFQYQDQEEEKEESEEYEHEEGIMSTPLLDFLSNVEVGVDPDEVLNSYQEGSEDVLHDALLNHLQGITAAPALSLEDALLEYYNGIPVAGFETPDSAESDSDITEEDSEDDPEDYPDDVDSYEGTEGVEDEDEGYDYSDDDPDEYQDSPEDYEDDDDGDDEDDVDLDAYPEDHEVESDEEQDGGPDYDEVDEGSETDESEDEDATNDWSGYSDALSLANVSHDDDDIFEPSPSDLEKLSTGSQVSVDEGGGVVGLFEEEVEEAVEHAADDSDESAGVVDSVKPLPDTFGVFDAPVSNTFMKRPQVDRPVRTSVGTRVKDLPSDPVEFVRANPNIALVTLQEYYSKSEIDRLLKMGRLTLRKGTVIL